MWRNVEQSTNQRCTDLATQHSKLTKSLEQGDMNGLILLPSPLSRIEVCYWEYVRVHMFRVGCPQLGLDTQTAHLLAPGHTMRSSGCWHKCSHTWRGLGLSWLPTTTPHPIPVASLLEIHSLPSSQITTLTWCLTWLDLCWHSLTHFTHLLQWLAPWISVSLRPEVPLQVLALTSTHWGLGISCHHRHTGPPTCALAAVTCPYTQTQERSLPRKRVKSVLKELQDFSKQHF